MALKIRWKEGERSDHTADISPIILWWLGAQSDIGPSTSLNCLLKILGVKHNCKYSSKIDLKLTS